MASAAQSYIRGYEYELPDGSTGVWNGKGFVSPDDYLRSRGQSQAQFEDRRAMIDRLDRAEKKTNMFSTGWIGGMTENWPGSPAQSLKADLAPLQSNEFISGTVELRQNSPTGAGVGNQSDAEGKRLEGRNTSFDVSYPTDDVRYNLGALRRAYERHTPGLSVGNPVVLTQENRAEIPRSAYFRAGDGRVYRNTPGAGFPGQGGAPAKPPQGGRGGSPPANAPIRYDANGNRIK